MNLHSYSFLDFWFENRIFNSGRTIIAGIHTTKLYDASSSLPFKN